MMSSRASAACRRSDETAAGHHCAKRAAKLFPDSHKGDAGDDRRLKTVVRPALLGEHPETSDAERMEPEHDQGAPMPASPEPIGQRSSLGQGPTHAVHKARDAGAVPGAHADSRRKHCLYLTWKGRLPKRRIRHIRMKDMAVPDRWDRDRQMVMPEGLDMTVPAQRHLRRDTEKIESASGFLNV